MTSSHVASRTETQSINKYTIGAIIFLVGLGTLLFNFRNHLMNEDAVPTGDSIWKISITSQLTSADDNGSLFFGVPKESPHEKSCGKHYPTPA